MSSVFGTIVAAILCIKYKQSCCNSGGGIRCYWVSIVVRRLPDLHLSLIAMDLSSSSGEFHSLVEGGNDPLTRPSFAFPFRYKSRDDALTLIDIRFSPD